MRKPQLGASDQQVELLITSTCIRHAHRYIFSSVRDLFVEQVRPRIVDAGALKQEADEWKRWHIEQSSAEQDLISGHARQSSTTPQITRDDTDAR